MRHVTNRRQRVLYAKRRKSELSSVDQAGKPAERRDVGFAVVDATIPNHYTHFLQQRSTDPTHRFIHWHAFRWIILRDLIEYNVAPKVLPMLLDSSVSYLPGCSRLVSLSGKTLRRAEVQCLGIHVARRCRSY